MPTYLIERNIPGASELTDKDVRGITRTSNDVVEGGWTGNYTWRHSYDIAGDNAKIYCIHEAEKHEDVTRARQARRVPGHPGGRGGPMVVDATGPRGLPT